MVVTTSDWPQDRSEMSWVRSVQLPQKWMSEVSTVLSFESVIIYVHSLGQKTKWGYIGRSSRKTIMRNSAVARKLRYFGHVLRKEDETWRSASSQWWQKVRVGWKTAESLEWWHQRMDTSVNRRGTAADQGSCSLEKRCSSCRQCSRQRIMHQRHDCRSQNRTY